jgi:hypothetical protein
MISVEIILGAILTLCGKKLSFPWQREVLMWNVNVSYPEWKVIVKRSQGCPSGISVAFIGEAKSAYKNSWSSITCTHSTQPHLHGRLHLSVCFPELMFAPDRSQTKRNFMILHYWYVCDSISRSLFLKLARNALLRILHMFLPLM